MIKKVFISYSWGNKEHQDWVVNLGKRLMNDSVDVILDKWSLKEGHDIHSFMEETVKADDIFRVLVLCNKNYMDKADSRKGGVGTETQIITPEIYGNVKQEKFIPIVLERDEEGKPYLPIYLKSLKYLDFSNDEFFEDSYEELLRNILEAPALPKPKLGTHPPKYITETVINDSEVNSKLRTLKNQIDKHPERINNCVSDFIDLFLEKLSEFQLNAPLTPFANLGEPLYENLMEFKILRDSFIEFLDIITLPERNLDVDELIRFFEKQPLYLFPQNGKSSWGVDEFESYRIIFHELFIYSIASCLKNKNYTLTGDLLFSKYYVQERYNSYNRNNEPIRFTYLYHYSEILNNYIRQKFDKITAFGYYAISNLNKNIAKELFILADTLCYVMTELYKGDSYIDNWYPLTYRYNNHNKFDFFVRLDSKRFFEKVKVVFDVNSPEELIALIKATQKSETNRDRSVPRVSELINVDKIAINR